MIAGKHRGECSMEGDGLRAEGESLVLFGLFRERLENRVLGRTLVFSGCWISILMCNFAFKICESRGLVST